MLIIDSLQIFYKHFKDIGFLKKLMTNKRIILTIGLFALLTLTLTSIGAFAAPPKSIGKFGAWSAYEAQTSSGKICYMIASPFSEKGNYKRRGDVRAFITHRPSEEVRDVFSYETGYTYKDKSSVKITIGQKKFDLFTHENMAWARDANGDRALARGIASGSTMVVRGVSSRGTLTTDKFSLKGSGNAYKAISRACGITP